MTRGNIKHDFEACGIFPVNPNIIPRSAFAPSLAFKDPAAVGTGSALAEVSGVTATETVSEDSAPSAFVDNSQASEGTKVVLQNESVKVTFTEDLNDDNLEAAKVLVNLSFS